MKTVFIAIVSFLICLWAQVSFANEGRISCHTPHMNKVFVIDNEKVVFENDNQKQTRSVASSQKVVTKKEAQGFTKVLNFEGNKYSIHVENSKNFDETEDYLSIRTDKGHEITYPITCKTI